MPTRRSLLRATAGASLLSLAHGSFAQDEAPAPAFTGTLPPAILALVDRSAEAVPISLNEREHRLERARRLLVDNKLEALIICTGASLAYFTGLHWGQSERFFAWVLPAQAATFIVCPAFEEARIRERMQSTPPTLPAAATTRVYPWQENESPFALLAHALRDIGIITGALGIEERTQFAFSEGIAHASPTLTIASGTPVTFGCRSIKSPAELALLHLANNITLAVYEAAWKSLEPGMTNRHVSELIGAAYARSGVEGDASCEVGPFSALPHGSLKPQRISKGEIILLDDGCVVEGYESDISRSFVLGAATDRQKRVFDIVHHAQAASLAAAHPGVPCEQIDVVARRIISDAGFGPGYKSFSHRVGHGIGMDGHEWPYLVGGNTTPLAAGMCFSDEPGIYLPGEFGIRLEDCWHVTDTGGTFFTRPSPSLEQPFAAS